MNYLGIEAEVRNLPELDRDFFPLYKFNHAFLASAAKPVGIALERSGGEMASVHTFIHGTAEMREASRTLEFEKAAFLRDRIRDLKTTK